MPVFYTYNMNRKIILVNTLIALVALAMVLQSQPSPFGPIQYVTADPTGNACAATSIALRTPNGTLYTCQSGVYAASGGSGDATKINGASVPASKAAVGTNSSSQIVDASATFFYPCNTTGTSTAYVCTSGYSRTLAVGTLIKVTLDENCGSSPTLNFDSNGALPLLDSGGVPITTCQAGLQFLFVYDTAVAGPALLAINLANQDNPNCATSRGILMYNTALVGYTCSASLIALGGGLGPSGIGSALYGTVTNCSSSASPAVCASANAGSVYVPAGAASTLVVNTTAVTANSQILLTPDSSLGTKLSVTCNTDEAAVGLYKVSARTAATSFTIALTGTTVTNGACFSYFIIN